jgi:RHS repeat-associated protein
MATISGTNCFTAYDGNGNITALINAADKSLAARYEYSPYGQLIRTTGLMAHQMPFRFSTKFWDEESGLLYYNFRFYNPSLGRWINRDPTTDQVFLNLYLFCHNNPISRMDMDGRTDFVNILCAMGINGILGSLTTVFFQLFRNVTSVLDGRSDFNSTSPFAGLGTAALEGFVLGAISGGLSASISGAIQIGFFSLTTATMTVDNFAVAFFTTGAVCLEAAVIGGTVVELVDAYFNS